MERQASHTGGFLAEMAIREALDHIENVFPAVVRMCERDGVYESFNDENQRIPANTLLRLDGVKQIPLAHVKVLILDDETATKTEKGEEYVNEYKKLVNQEFLIPLNLPYEVNIVLRPGSKPRYAVVEQILQDRPRYLRVNTDTALSAFSEQESKVISAGTVLEITRVISHGYENTDCLECRDTSSGEIYKLLQDERINFTAVQDEKTYTLKEVTTSVPLPVSIKFTDTISPHDIAFYDDTMVRKSLLLTYGSLQLISSKTLSCLVGCVQTPVGPKVDKSDANVVLMPAETFDMERVRIKQFSNDMQRLHFCQNSFITFDSLQFVYRKLYLFRPDELSSVIIRNPESVSAEDLKDYLRPVRVEPPKLPPKRRGHSVGTQYGQLEDIHLPQRTGQQETWKKILERTKLGFGRVHKELLSKVQQSVNIIHKSLQKQNSAPEDETHRESLVRKSGRHHRMGRSVSESGACPVPNRHINKGRPLPPLPNLPKSSNPRLANSDGYLIMRHADSGNDQIKPETIQKYTLQKIRQKNQTRDDFKLYTVQEVYACFDMCGLREVADNCNHHRLDGAYLTSDTFDIASLKESPFALTDFQIKKIEMIINGWRPNLQESL